MNYTSLFVILLVMVSSPSKMVKAQVKTCKVEITRLAQTNERSADSLLSLATITNDVIINSGDVITILKKIDTSCCIYPGFIYVTSFKIRLTREAAKRLSNLKIPLCCGIPVSVSTDGNELFRGLLWNAVSSFGTKNIALTQIGQDLIVVNQVPQVADHINSALSQVQFEHCLTN